ncbi:MAG TPA: transglycosylase SLT domain-containing protein [Pyrinomonadaceae bacterium]|nr:transglycosylase SLT domain-containing protein [Pyrinomonadaceae bacterium]
MFASLTQYIIAGLAALVFAPACTHVEVQPASVSNVTVQPAPVSNVEGATLADYEAEAERAAAEGQGDAALVNARRLDREGRTPDGQLAQLAPAEHMRRAAAYHANRAFAEAREHWQALIARYPTDTNVPAALFGMGRSLYQERRYAEALPFFEKLGREFAGFKDGRDGYYYVAATLLRLDRTAEAATRYGDYVARYPQGERIENAYLNAIDSWREAGRNEEALRWIARARERFNGAPTATNALFARLRLEVSARDWQAALRTADELQRSARFTPAVQTTANEINYLRGFALEHLKQTTQASAAYQAITDRVASYYGGPATARLRELGDDAARRAADARDSSVRREVDAAASLYPAPYREVLLRTATRQNVDPRFVLAVMRRESNFKTGARSPAAARGLLQLTPEIAAKYGPGAGFRNVSEDDLYRPEVNIGIGVAYLADLFRMFPNLPEAVAASYNGGEDNVARWVRRAGHADAGVFSSEVGFAESKEYVFKVMENYRAYQQLYTADLKRRR